MKAGQRRLASTEDVFPLLFSLSSGKEEPSPTECVWPLVLVIQTSMEHCFVPGGVLSPGSRKDTQDGQHCHTQGGAWPICIWLNWTVFSQKQM